jgi:hypothetical protein
MNELEMQIRAIDTEGRMVTGVVAPYDEVSYLAPDPAGERIIRGAFAKSIAQRGDKILLFVGHAHDGAAVGRAVDWLDDETGLTGTFRVSRGKSGDQALEDLDNDNFGGMSAAFRPLVATRGKDGVREVREAMLVGVSLVGAQAYDGALVLAHRAAHIPDLPPRPVIDLSPIPAVWLYDSPR